MKLAEVQAFDAVMRTRSTVRAAELLAISQPAISRAIARLESSTRLALFHRIRGRLQPTPEAELLYAEVRSAFIGLDRLRAKAATIREFGTGTLRVACYPALGLSFVPKAAKRFREAEPNATLTLHVAASSVVRDLIASGQFDIGLAADEIDITEVATEVFMTPRAVCVLPAGHALAAKRVVRPVDLAPHPLISLSPDDTVQRQIVRVFREAGIEPRIVVETQYSETVCNLALEGAGVGIANSVTVRASGFEARGLVVRRFEPEISFRALIVSKQDRVNSRLADNFVRCLNRVRSAMSAA